MPTLQGIADQLERLTTGEIEDLNELISPVMIFDTDRTEFVPVSSVETIAG